MSDFKVEIRECETFPEVKILQDIGAKKLGEKSGPLGISFTTKSDYIDQEIDLSQELRKRKVRWGV